MNQQVCQNFDLDPNGFIEWLISWILLESLHFVRFHDNIFLRELLSASPRKIEATIVRLWESMASAESRLTRTFEPEQSNLFITLQAASMILLSMA